MGMIDTVTKEFISDNEVFADVVNFFVFKGEKVVMPLKKQCQIRYSRYDADIVFVYMERMMDIGREN